MLFSTPFPIDQTNKELLPMNSMEFPYICNYTELDRRIDKCVPWHWHLSFEFDYIAEGEVIVRAADAVIPLKQGDALFINSGIIHDVCAKNRADGVKIYSHIFSPQFLAGMSGSIFEQKYISPIQKSRDLQFYIIHPDTYQKIRMIEKLLKSIINISENCGFSSASYFGKAFQEAMGCTPRDYRRSHMVSSHLGDPQ